MALTIGVDVGGTNTDAVIINQSEVICSAKTPTTEDVTSGLETAIREAINNLPPQYNSRQIQRVNIGTTHFVNAVVQRRGVVCVGVLRLCGPASCSVAPFADFPDDLRRVIAGPYHFLNGGHEYDGHAIITAIDDEEVVSALKDIEKAGISNIVITGVFSPVNADQEEHVKEIILQINPSLSITVSHDVGLIGLLERENASILNESLKPLCLRTVGAFQSALQRIGLSCPFYLTQNDGTIISATRAVEFPVLTFASGPTNSMRGAAHLSKLQDAIVVDIGGTTTDVGVLSKGFPRQSSTRVKVGGVNTNFRMPDVLSIGLGGGSHVVQDLSNTGNVTVGPKSIGYKLEKEALVFGGSIMTATDIAVAAGLCDIGDKQNVSHLSENLITNALNTTKGMLEEAIDQVKISKQDQPIILVGGGSVLIDPSWQLKGASTFIKPDHFQAANAVGAALSKVSGIVDRVFSLENKTEEEVMNEAVAEANNEAVKNGAKSGTIQTVDKMAVKLAYLPGNVTRIQIKTVGDLADNVENGLFKASVTTDRSTVPPPPYTSSSGHPKDRSLDIGNDGSKTPQPVSTCSSRPTDPYIDPDTGDWVLSEFDVECMAIGAGILGCGGGGSPYIGKLRMQQLIKSGKQIRVIHPHSVDEADPVVTVAFMGAPVILIEKMPSGLETSEACKAIIPFLRERPKSDKPFAAVVCAEIGGMNSMEPLAVAAELGIPVVDADGMGRAFPELQMFLPFVYGCQPYPAGIADEKGNVLALAKVSSSKGLENYFRIVCVHMGCAAGIAFQFMGKEVRHTHVKYTLSRIWRLGSVILQARRDKVSPVEAIINHEGGKLLFTGKITAVERRTEHGFVKGTITVESTTQENEKPLKVEFQNENYLAYFTNDDGTKHVLACVPDLISLVGSETGEPIPTEEVRYGLRVAVLAMCCSPLWTTPKALEVGGPNAFGYSDVEYVPVGEYVEHPPIPHPRQL